MQLRQYQVDLSIKANETLQLFGVVYLAMEVRTGKTLTALETAKLYNAKKVLFVTKKKAIQSIKDDYANFNYIFEIEVINYESLHLISYKPDFLILDEAHCLGAFPKQSKRTKLIKMKYSHLPIIFLSGTPDAESSSQWYNQFWVSNKSPFKEYINFYKFANTFVNVTQRHLGYGLINDYSKGITDKIYKAIDNVVLRFSQVNAGFSTSVKKNIHIFNQCEKIITIEKMLIKDKCYMGREDSIIADTGAKMLSKRHQLSGGTIILESGKAVVLSNDKAKFIRDNFKGKLAIFYYFKAELNAIQNIFRETITTDLTEFNNSDKHIALQQYSGAEGISLALANELIFYNFGMSGVKFIQAIDRLTTKERLINNVHFIISSYGVQGKIFDSVIKKESYSSSKYLRDYG